MQNIYQLILTLFVLSLISERIANFFKLKLSGSIETLKGTKSLLKWFAFGNTSIRKNDLHEEKEREFRVLKINLFFGCFVAVCFHADLFLLIEHIENPNSYLSWDKFWADNHLDWDLQSLGNLLLTLFGCVLTGAFLSFGSKFWHDTLDLLLQIKNYRSMLTTEKSQELQVSVSTMSDANLDALMRDAIAENYQNWKVDYPNLVGCTVGLKQTNGAPVAKKAIIFKVKQKVSLNQANTIPESITYKGVPLPTDVIASGIAEALMAERVNIGTRVCRQHFSEFGTISVKVKKNMADGTSQHFLLSCFHVLFPDLLDPNTLSNGPIRIDYNPQKPNTLVCAPDSNLPQLQGNVHSGILSPRIDAAIASISETALAQQTFDNTIVNGEADFDSLYVGTLVTCFGASSPKLDGYIKDLEVPMTEVVFKRGRVSFTYTFNKLMQVSMPCQKGDSGAPVLTLDGKLIGIITSGDDLGSFVLPFPFIKNALFVTL